MTKKFSKLLPMIGCFSLGLASIISANTPVETANLPIDSSKFVDFSFYRKNNKRARGVPYEDRYSFLDIDKLCAPKSQKSVGDFIRSMNNYKSFIDFITPLSQEDLRFYVEWADKIWKSGVLEDTTFDGGLSDPGIFYVDYSEDHFLVPISSQFFKKPMKVFVSIDKNTYRSFRSNRLIPELTKAMDKGENLSRELIEEQYRLLNTVSWFFNSKANWDSAYRGGQNEEAKETYEEINSGKSDAKVSIMTVEEYRSLFNTEEVDPKTQESCQTYNDTKRNLTFWLIAHCVVIDPLGNLEVMVFYTKERH